MKEILIALWLAPVAAPVWLLYLLPAWAFGLIERVGYAHKCVVFAVRPGAAWWWRLWRDWFGHSLPYALVIKHPTADKIDHEGRHAQQWRALGPLFPIVYLLKLIHFSYRDHPLERDARAPEDV